MANWWELDNWSDWDTLGEGSGQQYGLENLDLIQEGFTQLYAQDINPTEALSLTGPDYLDSSRYKQEELIRESFGQEFKDFELNKAARSVQLGEVSENVQRSIGKSGFAGGGTARANLESLTDEYTGVADLAHKSMKSKQLSATSAIYDVRKSFVDKLWEDYSAYQETDPDFNPDWDLFERRFVVGDPNVDPFEFTADEIDYQGFEDDNAYMQCIADGGDHASCSGTIPGEDIDTGGEGGTGCPSSGTCPDGYTWTCGGFSLTEDCSSDSCCTPLDPDDFVNPFE
mgnify:CR=1 FL=1|tara:strand:- start:2867 stop:3721 length:855 start_codon:yes stop_codon:yes gene_type:complete